jgi:hypothetical protein
MAKPFATQVVIVSGTFTCSVFLPDSLEKKGHESWENRVPGTWRSIIERYNESFFSRKAFVSLLRPLLLVLRCCKFLHLCLFIQKWIILAELLFLQTGKHHTYSSFSSAHNQVSGNSLRTLGGSVFFTLVVVFLTFSAFSATGPSKPVLPLGVPPVSKNIKVSSRVNLAWRCGWCLYCHCY